MGNNNKRIYIIALLALVIFGASVRLYNLTKYPTWWDEHANVFTASGVLVDKQDPISGSILTSRVDKDAAINIPIGKIIPIAEIVDKSKLGNILEASIYWDLGNGIAFTLPLHFWLVIFGYSDTAIRWLSLVFGILMIPAGFAVARKITDNVCAALVTAGLISCNALLVEYSREARSYSLAVLLSLLSTYVFLQILENKTRRPIQMLKYAILLSGVCFSHYLAVPVLLLAHLSASIFSSNRKNALICWLTGVCSMTVLFGLWMLFGATRGLSGMKSMDAYWLQKAISGTYSYVTIFHWKDAIRMLVERSVWFNCPLLIFWPPQGILNAILLILFMGALFVGLVYFKKVQNSNISGLIICGILSAGMLYSLALSWKSGHTLPFINRYNIFYIPYQEILIATGVVFLFKVKQKILRYILLTMAVIGLSKITYSNFKYALNPKPKETFSIDHVIQKCDDKKTNILHCRDRDTAIITALKINKNKKLNTFFVIDEECKSKVTLDLKNEP